MRCMDQTQTRIIELLREVHLLAFKEIERLNLRISELENEHRQPTRTPITKPSVSPAPPSLAKPPEMLNERQVAEYLTMSLASLRKWRLFPQRAEVRETRKGHSLQENRCGDVAQFVSGVRLTTRSRRQSPFRVPDRSSAASFVARGLVKSAFQLEASRLSCRCSAPATVLSSALDVVGEPLAPAVLKHHRRRLASALDPLVVNRRRFRGHRKPGNDP